MKTLDAAYVRRANSPVPLPIGRTARIAFEIDAMRAECSKAAKSMLAQKTLDAKEMEDCVRLDDALADAHQLLKCVVRNLMLSRLRRRSRGSKAQ